MTRSVILVGNNRLFLEGLSLIMASSDLTIALTCDKSSNLTPLLAEAEGEPSLIVWDTSTSDEHEIAQWRTIHREFPQVGIVVLTDDIDDRHIVRAVEAGVRGILPKSISANALKLTLKLIALGENLATFPINLAHQPPQIPAAFHRRCECHGRALPGCLTPAHGRRMESCRQRQQPR